MQTQKEELWERTKVEATNICMSLHDNDVD